MNKIKHPIRVGLLLLIVGLAGAFILKSLHLSTTYPATQTDAGLVCSMLAAAGGVMIFLHFANRSRE